MSNLKFKEDDAIAKVTDFNPLYDKMNVEIKTEEKLDPFRKDVDLVQFQYASVIIFNLVFYREPFSMLVLLAIYFQENKLCEKLASLITLLLGNHSLFPTLRAGLPSILYLTITDITACLCIVQVFRRD